MGCLSAYLAIILLFSFLVNQLRWQLRWSDPENMSTVSSSRPEPATGTLGSCLLVPTASGSASARKDSS